MRFAKFLFDILTLIFLVIVVFVGVVLVDSGGVMGVVKWPHVVPRDLSQVVL